MDVLGHEVELREEYNRSARHARSSRDESVKKKHTMHTGKQANYQNCAFCLGGHKHEDCQKVKNVSERKQLLIKFGRCFSCIRKGHHTSFATAHVARMFSLETLRKEWLPSTPLESEQRVQT